MYLYYLLYIILLRSINKNYKKSCSVTFNLLILITVYLATFKKIKIIIFKKKMIIKEIAYIFGKYKLNHPKFGKR